MCYPIVKEQDFPARRKGLQTNPDYRAPKAFCQTLSPIKIGGGIVLALEKKRQGMQSRRNARPSKGRGDGAEVRQKFPAKEMPSPGHRRADGREKRDLIVVQNCTNIKTCTNSYKYLILYKNVQAAGLDRRVELGYLLRGVFRGSRSAWRTLAGDFQLVQKRTSS